MDNLNQTKIYAIIITAVLLLGGPAGYFFTTQDMTLEIQQKDEKISKALSTLKKAKSSIEKKDDIIKTQSGKILICNDDLEEKNKEIASMKSDLENAYAGISDDIISTENENLEKDIVKVDNGTGKILEEKSEKSEKSESVERFEVKNCPICKEFEEKNCPICKEFEEKTCPEVVKCEEKTCPVCEKCDNNVVISIDSFLEKNELQTMDLAYTKGFGERGLPYVAVKSKTLLEMYNGEDEILMAKIGYYCSGEYLKADYYGTRKKAMVLSYQRSYCKDEKYENCPSEIKSKIDHLKGGNILDTNVVRILTKYNPENTSESTQEVIGVYNNFGAKVCSWAVNTSLSGKKSYVKI